jgi:16S rRNA (cytidine1402-2'-O)-methyltransferase
LPTSKEDAAINVAALSDPDAQPLSDAELTRLRPAEAASEVARALGLPRRDLYRRAMELRSEAG